ncbi:MAG: Hsp20 family protein [Gammaproteobacteria bacterium]
MANYSIYLENGQVWRQEQAHKGDPLRAFPELFNANATGRTVAAGGGGVVPEFEVIESPDRFLLSASITGLDAAQVEVRVTAQLVIVIGKTRPALVGSGERGSALPHPAFRKTFVLPTGVEARRLKVDVTGDLLTIELPKRGTAQVTRTMQKTP